MNWPYHLKRIDTRPIPERSEIRACLLVRNEMLRLPSTLQHCRELGVERFFIVDNASDDGTLDFVTAQTDAHIFSIDASYASSRCGLIWLNAILEAFCSGHWTLSIDADELFIYQDYERTKLPDLCHRLENSGARAMFSLLLDMYANKPIRETFHEPDRSLLDTCPYFDRVFYRITRVPEFPHVFIRGGPRWRMFRHLQACGVRGYHPPVVSKVPLVKWQAGVRYTNSTHAISPIPISGLFSALLHFKFLHDFRERTRIEITRGEHYGGAIEYRGYMEFLERYDAVNLFWNGSVALENSNAVVKELAIGGECWPWSTAAGWMMPKA